MTGIMLVAAVREELGDLAGEVVGVGPVAAAARAAAHLARRRPAGVILVGTAGAYAGGPPIGVAVASSSLGLAFGVATLGLGYTPAPLPAIDGDPALLARSRRCGVAAHPVLTVGAITTDPDLARRLGVGWTVEHLEAYGVALACADAGVPFVAVLGVSNDVGADAHTQWLAHREDAQRAARSAAAQLAAG
jgi:futalosine hydrolase